MEREFFDAYETEFYARTTPLVGARLRLWDIVTALRAKGVSIFTILNMIQVIMSVIQNWNTLSTEEIIQKILDLLKGI